jgi:hypothetical protein
MKLTKFINKNKNIIKLYIIFLDYLNKTIISDNINKVIAEFFIKLINNENLEEIKKKFFQIIKEKNITTLYNINFNKKIKIKKINYNISNLSQNNEYKIMFKIEYNDTLINIEKILPSYTYLKIHNFKNKIEKYLLFFYIIMGYDTGQFWGLHPKFYNFINGHFKNSIECFASPFNNNLNDYFSILYDIDKYYGSKGDFFANFLNVKYEAYIINPPFIDTIILKVLKLIDEKLLIDAVQIFFFIPQWDDIIIPWYNNIKTKYIHSICKLNKYESIVFDYIAYKPLKASFGTYFIYINNISSKLCNIMKLNYNDN